MKKLLLVLFLIFISTHAFAHKINWHADGVLTQTTCQSGDNISAPTPASKRGYHFVEWQASDNLFDITAATASCVTIIDAETFSVQSYPCAIGKLKTVAPGLEVGDSVTITASFNGVNQMFNNSQRWNSGATKVVTEAMLDANLTFYGYENNPTIITNLQIIKNNQ